MNFGSAIKYGFQNYANFKGVADRATYWWWMLLYGMVIFVVQIVSTLASSALMYQTSVATLLAVTNFLSLVPLALYLPTLALTIRRMRDVGLNPLLLLISIVPFFLIVIGSFIGAFAGVSAGSDYGSDYGSNALGAVAGGFGGALLGAIPGLLVALGWGIFLIVMLARPTKTAAQGNKYAAL